ncbi:hypothetical protein ABW19_dt0203975 [Dactylella cylindrospora]|nr:hypothetical protein ABW19_dt0203975 [Dactylella cylindrospora]
MELPIRRQSLPVSHARRSSVPRLSIIIKDSRFPDSKTIISSPISPCSPRTSKNRNIATVVVMSPRLFSPVGTPTKILSPAQSRRGSEESSGRRGSRTSVTMGNRRRESIIYRNEQEYDSSATAIVERKVSAQDTPMDEDLSSRNSVAPLVTKVRAYSISTKNSRRRAARSGQEQAPIIVAGPRRRSSIVVVHNCSPPAANREFSEMPEESEDEA